jgi:hypothetical protein
MDNVPFVGAQPQMVYHVMKHRENDGYYTANELCSTHSTREQAISVVIDETIKSMTQFKEPSEEDIKVVTDHIIETGYGNKTCASWGHWHLYWYVKEAQMDAPKQEEVRRGRA